jgi:signal transduction histidine kinase
VRWTIQRQFLVPVIATAAACFLASSVLSMYVAMLWADRREREHLDHVAAALGDAGFPLSATVLERMSGLSGAELVVLDAEGRPLAGAPWIDAHGREALRSLPIGPPAALRSQRRIDLGGRWFFAARLPLVSQSAPGRQLSLAILYPEERWTAVQRQLAILPLGIGMIGIVVLGVAVTLVAQHVVAPLGRLHRSALAISGGDFSTIALPQRNDEIRDLTVAINEMTQRLARYEVQVRQNERLRTLGQLGGGLAHQLRNAATGARIALDLHAGSCDVSTDDDSLAVAKRQLVLMESYIQRFLTLGQRGQPMVSRVPLGALVAEVAALLRPACQHARVELTVAAADELAVAADPKAIEQIVLNLLFNALEAVQQTSRPLRTIAVTVRRAAAGGAELIVEDSGDGPSEAMRDHLFEPFATDKPDGTGLGLATVKQIVEEHGGTVAWQREHERTRFTVTLPMIDHEPITTEAHHGAIADCR